MVHKVWTTHFGRHFLQKKHNPLPSNPTTISPWRMSPSSLPQRKPKTHHHSPVPSIPGHLLKKPMKRTQILTLTVSGFNKGGLLVEWHKLPGFVPASQLVDFPQFHVATQRNNVLKDAVGTSLQVKIIEVNPRLNRLIFSLNEPPRWILVSENLF